MLGRRRRAQFDREDATLIMRSLMRIEATLEEIRTAVLEEEDGDAEEES